MTRDEDPSINERDMVLGKELQLHYWGRIAIKTCKGLDHKS